MTIFWSDVRALQHKATMNPYSRVYGEIYKPKPEAAETTAYQRAFKQHYDSKNGARERSFAVRVEVITGPANKRRVLARVVGFQGKTMVRLTHGAPRSCNIATNPGSAQ